MAEYLTIIKHLKEYYFYLSNERKNEIKLILLSLYKKKLYNELSHYIIFYTLDHNILLRHKINHWFFHNIDAINKLGDISTWDTSLVTNMDNLFMNKPYFNDKISNWNTSKVTSMAYMFANACSFNQDLSNWQTNNLTVTKGMFMNAKKFNQNISKWNMEKVKFIDYMFYNTTNFKQDLDSWDLINVIDMENLFLDNNYYDTILNNPEWYYKYILNYTDDNEDMIILKNNFIFQIEQVQNKFLYISFD